MNRRAIALALCLLGCGRDLGLPALPTPPQLPAITSFSPLAAFSGDELVVTTEHSDDVGNQLVFPGGATALAVRSDAGVDLRVDGGLVFHVPEGLALSGPLVLSNTQGRSEPSVDDFTPMGTGHPTVGNVISQLRFRLNPVGLVDRAENVLLAPSIFDLVLTDGKAFHRVPGRPLAMRPSSTPGRALVSVRTEEGGLIQEVDSASGEVLGKSFDSDTRELFILPPADGSSLCRTVGIDTQGRTWISTWKNQSGTFSATRRVLPFSEVLGATAQGTLVMVVGRGATAQDSTPAVYLLTPQNVTVAWAPRTGTTCVTATGTDPYCVAPDGPMAIVPSSTMGNPPTVVASLASGDLLLIDGTASRIVTLISYAPINDMAAGTAPAKLVLTKAHDGALFQYDLDTEELDWSVQLKGEPSVINVAPDIDEIAVGNREDNAVDIVTASSGQWVGRVAFDLGLGSADGRGGGVIASYSKDPARLPAGEVRPANVELLMRNIGLVTSIGAESLDVVDHVVLDPRAGEALWMLPTNELRTMVVHRTRLGLLDTTSTGQRFELVVTAEDLPTPLEVLVLPSGPVIVAVPGAVRWYRWIGSRASRALALGGELTIPSDATLLGVALDGEEVLVIWGTANGFGGGFYPKESLTMGGQPRKSLTFDPALSDFVGLVSLRAGPAVLFGRKGMTGPAMVPIESLRADGPSIPSSITGAEVVGTSPDGRFLTWIDQRADQPMVRLVRSSSSGLSTFSTYRLSSKTAGPGFNASGELLFLPIPELDQVDVVQ